MLLRTSLAACAVALAATMAAAEATPPSVDRVLSSLHTEDVLGASQTFFGQAVARQRKEAGLNDAEVNQLLSLCKRIYTGKNLYAVFKQVYTKAITKEDMNVTFQWLSSIVGLKLRQGFDGLGKADNDTLAAYFKDHGADILRHNRKNALQSFEATWRQDEFYATFQMQMDVAVLYAAQVLRPAAAKESQRALKDRLKKGLAEYNKPARDYLKTYDFYLCKDLKNDEIDELTKFANSLAGVAHMKAYVRALDGTLDSAAATLHNQLIKVDKADKAAAAAALKQP